jgi:hypothetical protein
VTVKNHAGAAVADASVQIFDAAGQLVFSRTTDASGQVADIPVSLTEFQQLTSDPSDITSKALGPFRIVVSKGTLKTSEKFTMTGDLSLGAVLG